MQCIQCPPALSDVVTEFALGQHVCRTCGLVVPARRVYEDDAAARSVPTHTRLSMQRLAPSSLGFSSGGSGGARDGDGGGGVAMSASMAHVIATSGARASLPPLATSENTIGKQQIWGGNLLMRGVGRGQRAATKRDIGVRAVHGGVPSKTGRTSLGCSTNGGLFHMRRRENQRARILKTLQLMVQDACVAVGLNQITARGAENLLLECVYVLQSSAHGSEGRESGGSGFGAGSGGSGGSGRRRRTLHASKHKALSAAAVFVSCRQQKCSRTVNEVCSLTGVHEKAFRKAYKMLTEALNGLRVPPATPEQFMGRFRTAFKWEYAVERAAIRLVEQARRSGRLLSPSHAPAAVAAAALHMAASGRSGGLEVSFALSSAAAAAATGKVNRRLSTHRYGVAQPSRARKPPSLHALAKRLGLGLAKVKRAHDVLENCQNEAAGSAVAAPGTGATRSTDEGVVEDALTSSLSGGKARGDSPLSNGSSKVLSRPATPGTEHALTDCEESNFAHASEGSARKTDMFIRLVNDLES